MTAEENNQRFMLDTNIFNRILDGQIDFQASNNVTLYVTHIQFDEINNTKDTVRKNGLLAVFKDVEQEKIPTESSLWGISKWDECKWDKENSLRDAIKTKLDKRKKKENNSQDSLIAITAIRRHLILVTNDRNLRETVNELSGKSVDFSQFLSLVKRDIHEN